MGDISEHFSRKEFECNCGCGFDVVDAELIKVLEYLRRVFGSPIHITGPNRCIIYNARINGARDSFHTHGKAADIMVEGVHPKLIYEYIDLKYPHQYGLGLYSNRVHIDVRNKKARWTSL